MQASANAQSMGSSLDGRLRIFDAHGNQIADNDNANGLDPAVSFVATAPGIYYVGVSGSANDAYDPNTTDSGTVGSTGNYQLKVLVTGAPPVSHEVEANGSLALANTIAIGSSVPAAIGAAGDVDFYTFTIEAGGRLTLTATPDAGSTLQPQLTLYNVDQQPLLTSDGTPGATTALIQQHLPPGTYYLKVTSAVPGGIGAYHLSSYLEAATPPFQNLSTGQLPSAIATGDFNGDGVADLATADKFSGTVSVFLGLGDGTYRPAVAYSVGAGPIGIVTGDFNHDQHLDLAVINQFSGDLQVLTGVGNGTFVTGFHLASVHNPRRLWRPISTATITST